MRRENHNALGPDGYIEHHGVISKVDRNEGLITVDITDTGDCHACAAAKLCGKARTKSHNTLTIDVENAGQFLPGDKVTLRGSERLHRRAILLATVVPSILLVASMLAVYLMSGSQFIACISALVAMVVFFVVLWVFRDKIDREFTFTVVSYEEKES